jgi:hypothetical protein
MVGNIKSIKRFQKRKTDQNHQSRKKFNNFKKKGGAINVPIYRSLLEDEDLCPALTTLNDTIEGKDKKVIGNLTPEQLKATIPIYDFKKMIYSMCKLNDREIGDNDPILLVDRHDNYVFSNYNNLLDDEIDVDVFKITDQFQLEYLGVVNKGYYHFYTYDELYEENYQYTKDTYWINALEALDSISPSSFYNIVEVEYDDQTIEPNKNERLTLVHYKAFLKNFFPQRTITENNHTITTTIITDENNIIKNLSFLNRMEELIKLVNDDFKFYFTKNFDEFINQEMKKIKDKKISMERYREFLKKVSKKEIEKVLQNTYLKNDNDKLNKFISQRSNELKNFKLALVTCVDKENPNPNCDNPLPLVLDLEFLVFLYHKLFNEFDLFNTKSPFQEFLYSCILIHKSGFYNKFEITKHKKDIVGFNDGNSETNNDNGYIEIGPNNQQETQEENQEENQEETQQEETQEEKYEKIKDLLDGFFEIRDGYVYIDLATIISKGIKEGKFVASYQKKMDISIDEQMLIFFEEIQNFISNIHLVRDEFVSYDIGYCNEILKSIFLRTYIFYLKKGGDDIRRPFSIKSHFDKFLEGAIEKQYLHIIEKTINLVKQSTVTVTKEDKTESFPNCGERTLMNFFKYLLFDTVNRFITNENLDKLSEYYPNNLLKEIL